MFSEKTRIDLNPVSRQFVRRSKCKQFAAKYTAKTTQFSPSIMVWGGIRYDGKRILIKCENSVDSYECKRILEKVLPFIYNACFIFQLDGATCHTSHFTTQFLTDKHIRVLQQRPPQSPDLKIIEGVWAFLK